MHISYRHWMGLLPAGTPGDWRSHSYLRVPNAPTSNLTPAGISSHFRLPKNVKKFLLFSIMLIIFSFSP
jgi:hypothetical protein